MEQSKQSVIISFCMLCIKKKQFFTKNGLFEMSSNKYV